MCAYRRITKNTDILEAGGEGGSEKLIQSS
jgi:hypothetical protein